MDSFLNRFLQFQTELKAPKGQVNKFGGYKYRSCEDILEAAKPLLMKYHMALTVGDNLVNCGDRYYVCATATLRDTESEAAIQNSAYAREASEKKGMDEAQITGTASSYARKYALNGLFCIDDTKDPDADEYTSRTTDAAIKCSKCGKEIMPYNDGKKSYTVKEMVENSKAMFGAPMCSKCVKSAAKEKQNEDSNYRYVEGLRHEDAGDRL